MENILEKASVTESMFTAWFVANGKYEEARSLTYGQFVSKFVYEKKSRTWKPRKKGFTIGRLIWVPPTTGELFYLRLMLTVVKGPLTYEEIHKVGDTQFDTFRDACFAMGFLEDDREYIGAIREASEWGSDHFLRKLFVVMLLSNAVNRPAHVWNETWSLLSDGLLHQKRQLVHNTGVSLLNEWNWNFNYIDTTILVLTEEQLKNLTLTEIEKILQANRRSLTDFKPIPYPDGYVLQQLGNRLIYDERSYDVPTMRTQFTSLFNALTDEQRSIFEKIMASVRAQKGVVYFLHGYGGTGKTYMWRTLASALRSKHDICLAVATSGIASLLLPGGRTAHSKFKIHVPTMENSTCKIDYDDDVADLLRQTKLIIWDEAPMAHKHSFEALDRTLKDVMSTYSNSKEIFGGKVVVFGGDFRQILPIVPRGSRSDIVHSAINASYIWRSVEVLTLTQNMRLQSGPNEVEKKEIADFSKWLLQIGEGKLSEPNDGFADIQLPPELLITDYTDPIVAIVNSTYPDFSENYQSNDYLKSKAILASTLEVIDQINNHVLDLMPGLPNHLIRLKVGTPVMLMRNIDQLEGMCNGTGVMITKMGNHVIEAKIMAGKCCGNLVYIPRMDMSPSQSPWPFKLKRRQFAIIVSYAMTINKSQGQSLDTVRLYLPRDVFTHGQIYVALSRVTTKQGIEILVYDEIDKLKSTTTNIVYKEVFHNI
ncbi:ATP-dependent DNA helicase pfh1-like [Vicia villosa]|uniref:ATP-dependent DNA helicase pfh1-like n=1 Tax=Vicia villosa TaxID=3911 RepID=UPI00273C2D0C|nr:ATP-dependent DNA helicase pfh1-like [Vicia villosa]